MALYAKRIGRNTYYYLREMARVDGKPKMVSERYIGTAADVAALLEAREAQLLPERTRHLAFGDVAAAWGLLDELGVVQAIDEAAGPRPAGQPLSTGTYLALAGLTLLVAPCSKAAFGLVGGRRRGPVREDRGRGAGPPAVLGRDARGQRGAAGRYLGEDS